MFLFTLINDHYLLQKINVVLIGVLIIQYRLIMTDIYLKGFQDGYRYIEKKYSSDNDDKDILSPLIVGGGIGALGGNIYGGLKSSSEIREQEKLLEELERHKSTLNTLENDLSKVDRIKSLKAGFKDVMDIFSPNSKKLNEDLKAQGTDISRLKDMISRKKNEIEQIEKKMKPLRDKILRNRGINAAIGLGIGLTGAGLYNMSKKD